MNTADIKQADEQAPPEQTARTIRPELSAPSGLNRWLQIFLTIIAGAVVAVIAWNIIERFLHIIILLITSFLLAYLLGPIVDRIERTRLPRIVGILIVYLVIISVLTVGIVLLLGPLTSQLQDLSKTLPSLIENKGGAPSDIDRFFKEHGIPLDVASLQSKVGEFLSSASTSLLGGTLAIIAGLVAFVTDIFLILAITFYLLLDGHAMRNRVLRLFSNTAREKWFFIEATLNRVLGGYIRGQIIVAATVGLAAGLGSALIGVQYPLVIGLLAFLFEFIPLLGPVLGMIPAVIIAFFQSPSLALWTIIYFIVLQQVESNVIVPRISGHAVGLHPLGALLALLAGVELGGLGGALVSVPVVGVLYVLAMAIYSDATSQTELLMAKPQPTVYVNAYSSLRNVIKRRRRGGVTASVATNTTAGNGGISKVPIPREGIVAVTAISQDASAPNTITPPLNTGESAATSSVDPTLTPTAVPQDRLATIAQERAQLSAQFEADERDQAVVEQTAAQAPNEKTREAVLESGTDEVRAPDVPVFSGDTPSVNTPQSTPATK